jgi:hypothetical protein
MSCASARACIRRFVSTPIELAERQRLRAHMEKCADCKTAYHELVVETARLSRKSSSPESAQKDVDVHKKVSARSRKTDAPATPAPSRRAPGAPALRKRVPSARLFLPIALVLALLAVMAVPRLERISLRVVAGVVQLNGERPLTMDSVTLKRGDVVATGVKGRARVEKDGSSIEFDEGATFAVERVDRVFVQLFAGHAQFSGDATVVTVAGAVEAHGAIGSIKLDENGLEVGCASGDVTLIDGNGRKSVPAGESATFAAAARD